MGKLTRTSGATAAGAEQSDGGPVIFRGRRMAIKDGAIEFLASDGGAVDTTIRRSSAGVVELGGAALSGTLDVIGTVTAFGYLGVGGNAGVTGALDVAGSCSGIWGPRDNALIGATCDPDQASGTILLTGGSIYLSKIPISRAATPTKLYYYVTTGATSPTASQNWAVLLSSAGALLGTPTDIAADVATSGAKTATIAPGALSPGFVWGAIVCAAGVLPTLAAGPATLLTALTNIGLTAATYRHAINGTSQTTITARTPSSNTVGPAIWMGLGA